MSDAVSSSPSRLSQFVDRFDMAPHKYLGLMFASAALTAMGGYSFGYYSAVTDDPQRRESMATLLGSDPTLPIGIGVPAAEIWAYITITILVVCYVAFLAAALHRERWYDE